MTKEGKMPDELRGLAPVEHIEPDRQKPEPVKDGIALCLSGGGYRAMLFHLGALWRLNELGYLRRLNRVSSVSGGSITAGVLGMNWKTLQFDGTDVAVNLREKLVEPIRRLAGITIDQWAVIGGVFGPGSISDKVAGAYRKYLFDGATLQDLPGDAEGPRFVINATNVQSGVLWRFSKPYAADWRVGMVLNPRIELAVAVAASSAFPPVLSPAHLDLPPGACQPEQGNDLHRPPFTTEVVLSDGGVYDNLGLETAWKRYSTVLVSDGGGQMAPDPDPPSDWARHSKRVLDLIDNQVRSLRKRQLIGSYQLPAGHPYHRKGTYWGIRSDVRDYALPPIPGYPFDAASCPFDKTLALAETPTRLKALDATAQERLINWGYAICDVAMRRHVDSNLGVPPGFPYPTVDLA
jgi:NTE family protein